MFCERREGKLDATMAACADRTVHVEDRDVMSPLQAAAGSADARSLCSCGTRLAISSVATEGAGGPRASPGALGS